MIGGRGGDRAQKPTAAGCGCRTDERSVMRPIVAGTLGMVAWLLAPGNAGAQTVNELLQSCEAVTNAARSASAGAIDIPRAGIPCWYYMAAVQNAAVLVDNDRRRLLGVCAPPDATLMDHVRIFVNYARRHQKAASENAAAVAVMALGEAYPCPAN